MKRVARGKKKFIRAKCGKIGGRGISFASCALGTFSSRGDGCLRTANVRVESTDTTGGGIEGSN